MTVDRTLATPPLTPESLALFLQEMIVEYDSYRQSARRADARENVSIPVRAVHLSANSEPKSEPFHMVSRDVSCCGIGLFNTEPVKRGPIQLTFSSPISGMELDVPACVEHCTACGHYYIIGCRFIVK